MCRAIAAGVAMGVFLTPSMAEERVSSPMPGEAWKTSPFHGVPNAATGQNIPCVCRFKDRDFRLGQRVCMNTYKGVMVAVCDLHLNNTTWEPTGEPCEMS
ncbi:MAG: hypothetical protein ABL898_17110 [Hyphomicrobiaceae bacterium]